MRERHTSNIRQPVFPVIPTTVRQVDSAHEGHRLVDDDDLLVMGPQVDGGGDVVWVSHHLHGKRVTNLTHTDTTWCPDTDTGLTLMLG